MANEQNLITQRDRSPEERRRVAQMGQKASAEARRRKKSIREVLEVILALDAPEEMLQAGQELTKRMRRDAKQRGEAVDVYSAIAAAQAYKAAQGDTAAAAFVRDSVGDKPTDKLAQTGGPEVTEADIALLRKLDKVGTLEALTVEDSGKDG